MKFYMCAVGASIVLSGCVATNPPAPPKQPKVVNTKAPRCTSKRECEAMWISAQNSLELFTGMRLRIVTDGRLETFAPTSFSRMGGVVVKYPVGESAYEFRASFECYRYAECDELRVSALNGFNLATAGPDNVRNDPLPDVVGQPVPPPAKPPTAKTGEWLFQAERVPEVKACTSNPSAQFIAKGPGFESYTVACANGDLLSIRCEFGKCRTLK